MADIINFNKARKAKNKVDKKKQADENRVGFGLAKGDKAANRSERDKQGGKLDGLRIYRGPSDPPTPE